MKAVRSNPGVFSSRSSTALDSPLSYFLTIVQHYIIAIIAPNGKASSQYRDLYPPQLFILTTTTMTTTLLPRRCLTAIFFSYSAERWEIT